MSSDPLAALTPLHAIAESASSLYERLEGNYELALSSAAGEEAIARWRKLAAQEDEARFNERLAHAGWDLVTLTRALSGPPRQKTGSLPAWTETLAQALQKAAPSGESLARPGYAPDAPPTPFQELLGFFADLASERLAERVGARLHLLSESSRRTFESQLMTHLVETAGQTLLKEFAIFRHFRTMGLFFPGLNVGSTKHYDAFVRQHLETGLQKLFDDYPVLGRLLAIAVDDWVDATAEFLAHLEADWNDLGRTFAPQGLRQVTRIELGLSDRHQAGRSVIKLTFDDSLPLVYKPRDLGMEAAYNDLLAWINAHGEAAGLDQLQVLGVLDRGTHGWMQAAVPAPCRDDADVRRYYRRAGMLIALVYLLNGTDLHRENLIASGDQPVLVDLEMLLASEVRGPELQDGNGQLSQALQESVLISGLLPFFPLQAQGQELSALTGRIFAERISRQEWQGVNTDEMAIAPTIHSPDPLPANLPRLGDEVRLPDAYEDAVVEGFEAMYCWLMAHADALPLEGFKGRFSRHMLRNTNDYMLVLTKAKEPAFLKDGAARSLQIDRLASRLLYEREGNRDAIRKLLRNEHQALEHMDIPRFVTRTDSDALFLDAQQKVPDYFSTCGWDIVQKRRRSLSEADMRRQAHLIRGALRTSATQAQDDFRACWSTSEEELPAMLQPEGFLQEALRIGETLANRAITAGAYATWYQAVYDHASERLVYRQADGDLHGGTAGVGLYLAALGKATGEARFGQLALASLRRSLEHVQGWHSPVALGIGSGIGSWLYAFTKAGLMLDSEELLNGATRAAQLITPEALAEDKVYDVMGGSAGSILALLAYHRATGDAEALERAIACGRHMLAQRIDTGLGMRSWKSVSERPLCGYSHGAAGMAHALLSLHAATGETAFREAALEAIAYERTCFSPEHGNWPDLRVDPSENPAFMCSWCHGAPGITLGRIATLSTLDDTDVRHEIETGLAATAAYSLGGADHLCCGNFGRFEILVEASRRLDRPELLETARRQASWAIQRAERVGAYYYSPALPPGTPYFGLLSGLSGIGYGLLRLADPDGLPSVLSFS
ncbi:Lanthionine synthetase C-like protein [compost metagenome]